MKASTESAAFNYMLFDTTLESEKSAALTLENWRSPGTTKMSVFHDNISKPFLQTQEKNPKIQNEQSQPQPKMVYNVLNNCLKDF